MKKIILGIFILFSVSYGAFLFFQPKTGSSVGKRLPNLEFSSLSGEKVSVESLRGKKILINFTATWCSYCIAEKVSFQEEYRKIAEDNNLEVIVIFGNYGPEGGKDDIPKVLEYLKQNNYTFPAFFDKDRSLLDFFNVKKIPTSILVDEKGVILEIGREFHTLKMLKR